MLTSMILSFAMSAAEPSEKPVLTELENTSIVQIGRKGIRIDARGEEAGRKGIRI